MPRIHHSERVSLEDINSAREFVHKFNASLNFPFALITLSDLVPFGYMFPVLQRDSDHLLPESGKTVEDLKRLGSSMSEPGDDPRFDSATPSAYTYFGQFVDHEITLEANSNNLVRLNDPDLAPLAPDVIDNQIINGRSPRLDLDSVYGRLSDGTPAPRDGDRMIVGIVSEAGGRPQGKDSFNDLPRKPRSDDIKTDREARIGDARNDENLIIAQLLVAFLRAHNALVDQGYTFNQASILLRQHFQWIVIHDFLKRIADPEIVNEILADGNRFYKPLPREFYLPLEFTVAAFRFGHSMVRSHYRLNLNFPKASLSDLFTLTAFRGNLNPARGIDFDTLPENWIIEWKNFLDGGVNAARLIDTRLVEPLSSLRDETGQQLRDEARLGVRNLLRGYLLRIPTGQAVATALGLPVMEPEQIEKAVGDEQALVLRETGLSARTPLWYYILAETAGRLPDHLGPVGSTIVAEVLIGLVRRSEDSILNQPGWVPSLGPTVGRFTLRDLLRLAGVLQQETISQNRGGMRYENN